MEENTSYAENYQRSESICWHKALCSLFEYSFSLIATKITTQNAGSHLQGFADSICLLRQGLCALHPLFQSVQPGSLKIQIVKQFNPTRPDLLNRQGQLDKIRSHLETQCISTAAHSVQSRIISFRYKYKWAFRN